MKNILNKLTLLVPKQGHERMKPSQGVFKNERLKKVCRGFAKKHRFRGFDATFVEASTIHLIGKIFGYDYV